MRITCGLRSTFAYFAVPVLKAFDTGEDFVAERFAMAASPPLLRLQAGLRGSIGTHVSDDNDNEISSTPKRPFGKVRSVFPETWIWAMFHLDG